MCLYCHVYNGIIYPSKSSYFTVAMCVYCAQNLRLYEISLVLEDNLSIGQTFKA